MNYQLHYDRLIERAKTRTLDCYVERHHIIPRCMGGDNSKHNLVKLTPEEHFLAHQLLVKIYPNNYKLVFAATCMTRNSNGKRTNNRLYGWLRKELAQAVSKQQTGRAELPEANLKRSLTLKGRNAGKNNPFYGCQHTQEFKDQLSEKWSGKNNPFYGSSRKGSDNPFYGKHPQKYKCPHCGTEASKGNLTKWHNDNCKQKEMIL